MVEVPLDLFVPALHLLELRFEVIVFGTAGSRFGQQVVAGICIASSDSVAGVAYGRVSWTRNKDSALAPRDAITPGGRAVHTRQLASGWHLVVGIYGRLLNR